MSISKSFRLVCEIGFCKRVYCCYIINLIVMPEYKLKSLYAKGSDVKQIAPVSPALQY